MEPSLTSKWIKLLHLLHYREFVSGLNDNCSY